MSSCKIHAIAFGFASQALVEKVEGDFNHVITDCSSSKSIIAYL